MATAYHRDQPGAPALVYSTSQGNIAHFNALKTVLKACLVSGYAGRPAAGWELISEGDNFITLRTGTHAGYVGFTRLSSGVVRVYLSETYTGVSGDVMQGDGLKTGIAIGSSVPQVIGARYLAYSSAASSWAMVADSKTFALSMLGSGGNPELVNVGAEGFTLYAGEDSSGAMIALGGSASNSTLASASIGYFSSANGMTVLKDPSTGLLVGGAAIDAVTPALLRNSNQSGFGQVIKLANAQLNKIAWSGNGVLSGTLRGVVGVSDLVNALSVSQGAQCLGRNGLMTYRDTSAGLDLGDAHGYFVGAAHQSSFVLLTDNPAFW